MPGIGIALATGGGLLVYAGLKGQSPLVALRGILTAGRTGTAPTPLGGSTFQPIAPGQIGGGDFGTVTGGAHPELANAATRYLGRPYRWGGVFAGSGGGDCSGLVYRAYRDIGVTDVPRTATAQMLWGKHAKIPRSQVGAGDLTYWPGFPAHIGIAINNTEGIYSPRTGTVVQIQKIDRPRAGLICLRYTGQSVKKAQL